MQSDRRNSKSLVTSEEDLVINIQKNKFNLKNIGSYRYDQAQRNLSIQGTDGQAVQSNGAFPQLKNNRQKRQHFQSIDGKNLPQIQSQYEFQGKEAKKAKNSRQINYGRFQVQPNSGSLNGSFDKLTRGQGKIQHQQQSKYVREVMDNIKTRDQQLMIDKKAIESTRKYIGDTILNSRRYVALEIEGRDSSDHRKNMYDVLNNRLKARSKNRNHQMSKLDISEGQSNVFETETNSPNLLENPYSFQASVQSKMHDPKSKILIDKFQIQEMKAKLAQKLQGDRSQADLKRSFQKQSKDEIKIRRKLNKFPVEEVEKAIEINHKLTESAERQRKIDDQYKRLESSLKKMEPSQNKATISPKERQHGFQVKMLKLEQDFDKDIKAVDKVLNDADNKRKQAELNFQIIMDSPTNKITSPLSFDMKTPRKDQSLKKPSRNKVSFNQMVSIREPKQFKFKDIKEEDDEEVLLTNNENNYHFLRDKDSSVLERLQQYNAQEKRVGPKDSADNEYDIFAITKPANFFNIQEDSIKAEHLNLDLGQDGRHEQQKTLYLISQLIDKNAANSKDNDDNDSVDKELINSLSNNFEEYAKQKDQSLAYSARQVQEKSQFYQMCKHSHQPRIEDQYQQDCLMKFYQKAQKELVLVLPLLNKILNKSLNLVGYKLNSGICKALCTGLIQMDTLINKIQLDNNGILDKEFSELLVALNKMQMIRSIVYKNNEFGQKCLNNIIPIFHKGMPEHLDELRIINCKILSSTTNQLVEEILKKSFIRKLALVNANLSEKSLKDVALIIKNQKMLVDIDISWNGLRPNTILQFLEVLSSNKNLQYVNLAWNCIMDKDNLSTPEQEKEFQKEFVKFYEDRKQNRSMTNPNFETQIRIVDYITRFIKYNRNLLHFDLSSTGLSEGVLWQIGTSLRRARSLNTLHLSGNPGITPQLKKYLQQRIHCKPQEKPFILQFTSKNNQKFDFETIVPKIDKIEEGLQLTQVHKQKKLQQITLKQPRIPDGSTLFFSRILGQKEDMPGVGQFRMYDKQNDDCWLCDKWVYSLIFWSKTIAANASLDIDLIQETQLIKQLEKNTTSEQREYPVMMGPFNNWKEQKFLKIEEYCRIIDKFLPNFVATLKQRELCRQDVEDVDELNPQELELYNQLLTDYQKKYTKIWKDILSTKIKYKKTYFINGSEIENCTLEEQIYVFPVYLKPGKHQYVIKEIDNSYCFLKSIAPPREEDVQVCKFLSINFIIVEKISKKRVVQRVFVKENSVFKDWKEDTARTYQQCGDHDRKYWKIPRFIKDPEQQEKCWEIINKNIAKLKDVYMTLISKSQFPYIGWNDWTLFCEQIKIPDKNVNLSTIDRLFIASNVEMENQPKQEEGGDKALCRFEFFEILVRLANAKFREPGICSTYSDALERLLKENIFPLANPHPWQDFRDNFLWTIEVNDVFEANLDGCRKLYNHYFEPRKKWMSMGDAMQLVMRDSYVNLIEKDSTFCYGMCKMTVPIESEDTSAKYKRLQFVEFLEFIGRVADQKYRHSDMDEIALSQKIEFVLDDILAVIEVKRKDVNIVIDEQSESDDEY